jgi:hypothetical protein
VLPTAKVRRLYDIANILTALRVVAKVRPSGGQSAKPIFQWVGPGVPVVAPPLLDAAGVPLSPAPRSTRPAPASGPGLLSTPDTPKAVAALAKAAAQGTGARSLFAAAAVAAAADMAPAAPTQQTVATSRRVALAPIASRPSAPPLLAPKPTPTAISGGTRLPGRVPRMCTTVSPGGGDGWRMQAVHRCCPSRPRLIRRKRGTPFMCRRARRCPTHI